MTDLRPCSGCRRHVSIDERVCPFCEATLTAASPQQPLFGRLSRAAVFAGAAIASTAACGGKKKPETTTNDQQTVQTDAGMIEEKPPDQKEPADKAPMPMPYGAPPARRRVV